MSFFLHKWNTTIRMRLTVLYGSAFFLAGLALIGVLYFQLNEVIGHTLIYRSIVVPEGAAEAPLIEPRIFRFERGRGRAEPPGDMPLGVPEGFDVMRAMEERYSQTRTEALNRIMAVSLIALAAFSALAAALGWLLAGQVLQPLRQITSTARGIADRNLHQRVGLQGPQDEIKDLADTLDDMLRRLERAFDSQQRFIANASHELRTPLAINRTLIEVALLKEGKVDSSLAQLGANLLAINQRHERLIDGLLMLASGEQDIVDPQPVDLADVARHVLTECAATAHTARVELWSHVDAAPCRGDPVLLERLVQNLVDNAIRYNVAENGWIAVTTGTDAQGRATIAVENSGGSIPPGEVPRLFEPFRRLTSTERQADVAGSLGRRGAGLGLSIVRAIVASHGGEVRAVARDGGGLSIDVTLPPQT